MSRLTRVGKTLSVAVLLACSGAASAQVLVVASSNDNPNNLINAIFSSPTMTYGPEIANTGTTTGLATTLAFNQARLHTSTVGCSLLAMTNNGSNNVSIWTVNGSGALTAVPGSPFATGAGTQSIAWAPDGSALYVPLGVAGASEVVRLTVACDVGTGATTVTNAGSVTLSGFILLRDAEVIGAGAGTHLCVSGTTSNNVGCFALTAGVPSTTPVNTIAVTNVRGMRIAPNGCGIAGVGNANTVQGFSVSAGTITATNTGATTTNPRYGAISDDGTLAAFGGFGTQFTLFSVSGACALTLVGSDAGAPTGTLLEYMAFDETNRLFVSDSLANQIRVFAPSGAGIGAAVSTSTTNHATANAPSGIDVASLTSLPVELMQFSVD